jgi:zinc/manganese transport system substrate-binding protein
MRARRGTVSAALPVIAAALIAAVLGTACSSGTGPGTTGPGARPGRPGDPVAAVGAENQYANVIGQIGGHYVRVTAIESNPNVDPHSYEASPGVAQSVSTAQLVVQNGLGYDTFMNRIEAATANPARRVIDVQSLLGLPDSTPDPHLWYAPGTMPAVAKAIAGDLSAIQPAHAAFFAASLRRFDQSLQPWYRVLAQFKAAHPGIPVAVTEPVGDYLLQAAGAAIRTPFTLQADVMNGVDPSPQDVSLQEGLLSGHSVAVLLYNQQVTDALTRSFLGQAGRDGIPVVSVYETMPAPGYDYQSWMLAEVRALQRAVTDKTSTQKL